MRTIAVTLALLLCFTFQTAIAANTNVIRVALFDDAGASGKGVPIVTDVLGKVSDVKLTKLKGADIASGALKDFDVVVFTGGSASKQGESLGAAGREEVQRFVNNGGGYIGICAGAYLACSGYSWGLGVLNAKTVSPKWQRGRGDVEMEITAVGGQVTGLGAGKRNVFYANGPIIQPANRDDIPTFEALATFRSELAKNGTPAGIMVDSPAIVRGAYGSGRVLSCSPHPEQTVGMEPFVEAAVRSVARQNPVENERRAFVIDSVGKDLRGHRPGRSR